MDNFKISIRVSIISLFILLLSIVGGVIIALNHYALDRILLTTSRALIEQTSTLIKQRLQLYLQPLDHHLIETGHLINLQVINPNDKAQFNGYLYELANHNPDIYGAYWSTPDGDFYAIDRENHNKLMLQSITRSQQPPSNTRYELASNAKVINTISQTDLSYDPRLRPWYQAAKQTGKAIWTRVYSFHLFANQPYTLPGITAAIPVYNEKHQLRGIFGIDLTIANLAKFIASLKTTPHTIIYITDQHNYIVAFHSADQHTDLIGKQLTMELAQQFHIPLPPRNFEKSNNSILTYKIADKEYFASHQSLTYSTGNTWHITIIEPADDIFAPLKQASVRTLLLTIISLLGGIMIVRYISQHISDPIIQLANEAKAITELNLNNPVSPSHTLIKETSYMNDAFAAMRSSLKSFQRYVPSSLVKNLISTNKIAEVGGENVELSFLFSDIKNFTQLAEQTEPQRLMQFLSEYFEAMTDTVINGYGTLDKYIGDAVMAFWNAPLPDPQHALHACQTAVAMLEKLQQLNQNWRSRGLAELEIRIGINTGHAVVGNVGSEERLSYTAIGDSVNLGSRLESLNKFYGTHIIVSQMTYELVKSHFTFRLLDHVAVRGKQQGIAIYELVTNTATETLAAYQMRFNEAFNLYQQGNWQQSLRLFEALATAYPDDKVAILFIERIKWLIETKPTDWNGTWRMD